MKQSLFIGTKLILAVAMTRQEYNDYREWQLPEDESHLANEPGMLVEYIDGSKANHPDHEGYISWSPQDVFDNAYKPSGEMSFGMAVEAAKRGYKVARKGWNGLGMFVYIVPAQSFPAQTEAAKSHFGDNGLVPYREYWALKTAQEDVVMWAPSGSDSLANDWLIVE